MLNKKRAELYDRTWMGKARAICGLSIAEAASQCGISPGFYCKIEQGLQLPNVRAGLQICKVLGVAPEIWLTEKPIA